MIADRYAELAEFLGSYFYPSSGSEYGSFDEAIADFLLGSAGTDLAPRVLAQLDSLLAEPLDDREFTYEVFDGGPLGVRDPSRSVREFLQWIRDRLAAGL